MQPTVVSSGGPTWLAIILLTVLAVILTWRLLASKRSACPLCGHRKRHRKDNFCSNCGHAFRQGFAVITEEKDQSQQGR